MAKVLSDEEIEILRNMIENHIREIQDTESDTLENSIDTLNECYDELSTEICKLIGL